MERDLRHRWYVGGRSTGAFNLFRRHPCAVATARARPDEAFPGFNQSGRGKRLFGDDGKPTPYVEDVLKFLGQYQREFQRTQAFCKKLKDLNLLELMQAQIKLGSGERMALGGFSVVDRARLKTLSGDVLAQLVQSDELELIYAHLVSMRNFATVRDRLAEAQPAPSAGRAPLTH
jgi:hypothetical protein